MASNNFGTGGYGLEGAGGSAQAARAAAAMLNPYYAAAQLIVSKASQPIEGAVNDAHNNNQKIVMHGQQDINAQHHSPFGAMADMQALALPGAEKLFPVNVKPLGVAAAETAPAVTQPDSGQSPFVSSQMEDYLNYMKYRGGY